MSRKFAVLATALLAVFLWPATGSAQFMGRVQIMCAQHGLPAQDAFVGRDGKERVFSGVLNDDKSVMEIWQNDDGDWTLVVTGDAAACRMLDGDRFEAHFAPGLGRPDSVEGGP